MLKLNYDNLYGTNIQQVNELEFEGNHYNFVHVTEAIDDLTGKYVAEKTFQCREQRKQLYLYVNLDGVVYHHGNGSELEDVMMYPKAQ